MFVKNADFWVPSHPTEIRMTGLDENFILKFKKHPKGAFAYTKVCDPRFRQDFYTFKFVRWKDLSACNEGAR